MAFVLDTAAYILPFWQLSIRAIGQHNFYCLKGLHQYKFGLTENSVESRRQVAANRICGKVDKCAVFSPLFLFKCREISGESGKKILSFAELLLREGLDMLETFMLSLVWVCFIC